MDEAVLPVLRRFCHVLITTLTSDPLPALYQLVIGEARRFPHLAQTFYEPGPRRGKARLAVWMAARMAPGQLRRDDPLQAVYQLAGLFQSGFSKCNLLNLPGQRRTDSARTGTQTQGE